MTRFIGIGHYSRVGKDTLANYILDWLHTNAPGMVAVRRSFASKLKEIAHDLYGWAGLEGEAFYNAKENEHLRRVMLPELGMSPVDVWCKFGTDAIRANVYDKTWVDYVLKSQTDANVVVIPDVRFPSEAAAIKEAGGTLIKVVRPGYGPLDTTADRALVGYAEWDLVVGATGKINELAAWGMAIGNDCKHGEQTFMPQWMKDKALSVESAC